MFKLISITEISNEKGTADEQLENCSVPYKVRRVMVNQGQLNGCILVANLQVLYLA